MVPHATSCSTTNCNTDLTEPLLPQENDFVCVVDINSSTNTNTNTNTDTNDDDDDGCDNEVTGIDGNDIGNSNGNDDATFCLRQELFDMISLGLPLAISFFCRMGMASTDSAFVGHIRNDEHSPEIYLAAAVLSDMVLNICITPPLAFNQVLNGLVSQAIGSNNPQMAGIWLQQSMFWLSISMLPCLIGLFYVEPILLLLGFPSDISLLAGTYAKYNVLWPIPNGWYQCMRFYFQARGLPRPAMYNNIIFFFLNALFNWIFVFGGPFQNWNGFGFIGAAISLSMSRTMQPLCYCLYMFVYQKNHIDAWPEKGWSFSHHTSDRTKEFMKQSIPNIGTLLFQAFASQTQTVLVGKLGTLSIAASSALSTITIPWSGTLSATCCTVSSVRVGYHLGKGNAVAAKRSSWIVMCFITIMNGIMAIFFLIPYFKNKVMTIATDDEDVIALSKTLIPAMLMASYLNLLVNNGTSGIFMGQGRPLIATILSFGLELPLSIGGVAIYILYYHGNLLGVYWWSAISAGIEIIIVLYLVITSNWTKCAEEARERQEIGRSCDDDDDNDDNDNLEEGNNSSNNNNRYLEEDLGDESNRLLEFQSPSMVGREDPTNTIPRHDDDNGKFNLIERNTDTNDRDLEKNRGEKLLVVAAGLKEEQKETAEAEERTRMQQVEKKQRRIHVEEEEKRRMEVAETKARVDVLTKKATVVPAAATATATAEEEGRKRVQAEKKCRQEEEKKRQIQVETNVEARVDALTTKVEEAVVAEEKRGKQEKEHRQIQAEVKEKADAGALATKVKAQAVEEERRQIQVEAKADTLASIVEAQSVKRKEAEEAAGVVTKKEEERKGVEAEAVAEKARLAAAAAKAKEEEEERERIEEAEEAARLAPEEERKRVEEAVAVAVKEEDWKQEGAAAEAARLVAEGKEAEKRT